MNGIISRVVETAQDEIGVRENYVNGHFSNRGRRVDQYQDADTLPGFGYAWCVSFLAWIFLTTLGRELCDQVWLRSASCDAILAWARKKGIVSDTPTPGCAGLVLASRHDATHGFLVKNVLSNAVTTIEGNTNTGGAREGNGVYARKRLFSTRYAYLEWKKLFPVSVTLPSSPIVVPARPPSQSPFPQAPTLQLYFGEKRIEQALAPVVDGRAWLPAYKWAAWMHAELGWIAESQTVAIAGREVPAQPVLLDGRAWLPARALAQFSGLDIVREGEKLVITQ